jgi:hypothetical protein
MKKTFTILSFITAIALNAIAQIPGQPIKGVIVKGGKNPGGNALISLSGGVTNPGSPTKQNANITNGYAFNANVYIPLFAKGGNDNLAGKTDHFFSVGPNAGGEYFGSNKDYVTSNFTPYNITGQSTSPSLATRGSGSPKVQGFKAELGLQSNFSFGQFTISPILNAAYLSVKQQVFAIIQSSSVNGQNRDFNLYTQAETKTSGFAFVPKLRLAYFPGKLGFFVDGNYTIGPSIKNETTAFTPQGTADGKGFYSIDQMLTGSNIATVKTTKYNSLGFNFGVSLGLGKGITEKEIKKRITEPQTVGIAEKRLEKAKKQANETELNFLAENIVEKSITNNTLSDCVILLSPRNGSSYTPKQNLEIKASITGNKTTKATITLYKIANDKDFLFKANEEVRKKYLSTDFTFPTNYAEEAKNSGFIPLVLESTVKDGQITQMIPKDRLSEGSYKLIINTNNGCPSISSNFSITTADINITNFKIDCTGTFGSYTFTLTAENPGNAAFVASTLTLNPTVTGLTINTLPVTINPGSSNAVTITGSFNYTGTTPTSIYVALAGNQLGNTNLPSMDTDLDIAKPCICDFCETISWNTNTGATATLQGNSININQSVTVTAVEPIVATKAEIIAFERYVGDDCITCDKTSNQWGNFNTGTFASANGAFGMANGGVTGNTTHSLYWNGSGNTIFPATSIFNLNISTPPLSNLACCCERLVITIRYTYSFKDPKTGICKMCSFIKHYTMQKGNCGIISEPAGPVKANLPNIKNF